MIRQKSPRHHYNDEGFAVYISLILESAITDNDIISDAPPIWGLVKGEDARQTGLDKNIPRCRRGSVGLVIVIICSFIHVMFEFEIVFCFFLVHFTVTIIVPGLIIIQILIIA